MLDAGINCTILLLDVNSVVADVDVCCEGAQSDKDVADTLAATPTCVAKSPTPNGSRLELPFSSTILSIATPPQFCKKYNAGCILLNTFKAKSPTCKHNFALCAK